MYLFFFFNDTATTEIYTLSLHDALPILKRFRRRRNLRDFREKLVRAIQLSRSRVSIRQRSEEHTSELQSLAYLVCRLLLEKKKKEKHEGLPFDDVLRRPVQHECTECRTC